MKKAFRGFLIPTLCAIILTQTVLSSSVVSYAYDNSTETEEILEEEFIEEADENSSEDSEIYYEITEEDTEEAVEEASEEANEDAIEEVTDYQLLSVSSGYCGYPDSRSVSWSYNESAKTLTFSGTGAIADYSGKKSAPWYSYRNMIRTVIIGEGITRVGSYCLCDLMYEPGDSGADNFITLKLPSTLQEIGTSAFDSFLLSGDLVIPESVKRIEPYAFCNATITGSVILKAKISVLEKGVFASAAFTSFSFPETLTEIEENGMSSLSIVKSLVFPKNLKKIGSEAFDHCHALRTVEFTGNAPQLADDAFSRTSVEAYYPRNDATWSESARAAMSKAFSSVTWYCLGEPKSTQCGDKLTWEIKDKTLYIKGTGAMWDYSETMLPPWYSASYKYVSMSEGLTKIGAYAFYKASGNHPTYSRIPQSVTEIGDYAFYDAGSMETLILPTKVKVIGKYAFSNIYCIKNTVEIPQDIEYIGDYAFREVSFSTDNSGKTGGIRINGFNKLKYLGDNAFQVTGGNRPYVTGKITFPETLTYIGESVFTSTNVEGKISLPKGLLHLGAGTFYGCKNITGDIVIPDGITEISGTTFCETGITSVTIGKNVTSIGHWFCGDCASLKKVRFLCEYPKNGSFRNDAFYKAPKNIIVEYDGSKRSWRNPYPGAIGMSDNEPVFCPFYPDKECTVTFQTINIRNDEKHSIPSQKVKCGQLAKEPDISGFLKDYDVVSWRYRYSENNPMYEYWDFDFAKTAVTDNITIFLSCRTPSVSIAFDFQNGDKVYPYSVVKGTTLEYAFNFWWSNIPKKEGYTFLGWSYDKNGTTTLSNKTEIVEDTTVYAVWEKTPEPEPEPEPEPVDPSVWGDIPEEVRSYMKFKTGDDIPKGIWIIGSDRYKNQRLEYTGKAQKLSSLLVFDGNKNLNAGKEYSLKYSKNINAGTAAVTVTFKGAYSKAEKKTYEFKIAPKVITSYAVSKTAYDYSYDKKAHKPKPVMKAYIDGKLVTLKAGKHFVYDYGTGENGDFVSEGDSFFYIRPTENYSFSAIKVSVNIQKKILISKASAKIGKQAYTGKEIKPEVTVTYKKKPLVKGTDYEISYEDNIDVGKGYAVITGKGDFFSTVRVPFTITGTALSKTKFTGSLSPEIYTGAQITKDFDLTYTAGKGDTPVTLRKIPLSDYAMLTRKQQRNYDCTYYFAGNTGKGKAKLYIQGVSGYTGSLTKSFTIKAYNISQESSKVTAGLKTTSYKYVKGGVKPEPTVTMKLASGKTVTLAKGTDYTLKYKNNTKKGNAIVQVIGKGNFTGTININFTITD
ncbi:leucine-rich repeat protein [Butyrivibrio sp. AE3009]|uniref:leucine-rich repeat protein n=1 Tax=Butyrivibrio sp. AE3009 TaxID=1280666 RepID=UPI0003B3E68E|nr:leucine-rich repeat protein [Butyrivibrio sp. AE3009]